MSKIEHVDQIVLTKENQKDDIAKKLGDLVLLLLSENEEVSIREEETGIYVISHAHDNSIDHWGGPTNMWLNEDEVELVEACRENDEFHSLYGENEENEDEKE